MLMTYRELEEHTRLAVHSVLDERSLILFDNERCDGIPTINIAYKGVVFPIVCTTDDMVEAVYAYRNSRENREIANRVVFNAVMGYVRLVIEHANHNKSALFYEKVNENIRRILTTFRITCDMLFEVAQSVYEENKEFYG